MDNVNFRWKKYTGYSGRGATMDSRKEEVNDTKLAGEKQGVSTTRTGRSLGNMEL